MKSSARLPSRPESGMTLIEVLVSILIFSFGLLGFVGLQSRAIQYSVGAEDSNRAALLANEMASRMVYRNTLDTADTSLGYAAWQARVADATGVGLSNGTGTVVVAGGVATIKITWTPPSAAPSASPNRYLTQVILPP